MQQDAKSPRQLQVRAERQNLIDPHRIGVLDLVSLKLCQRMNQARALKGALIQYKQTL